MSEIFASIQHIASAAPTGEFFGVWREALFTAVLFVAGFFILIKGSDILTDGASSIARLFSISDWVIGVVIIGIGTSIPEFAITFASAIQGTSVGLGTVIGSNTFNLLFILGMVAVVTPVVMDKVWVRHDLLINIGSVVVIAVFMFLPVFGDKTFVGITLAEGVVVAALFVLWMWHMIRQRRDGEKNTDYKTFALLTSVSMIIGGLIGVVVGGKWVVDGAVALAGAFGISDALIGLTIIGIGTSLPEIVVSLTAAWKGRAELAIGNIIGSNIFDFLGIIGIVSLFRPLPFPSDLHVDIFMTMIASMLIFGALYVGARFRIGRGEGLLLICAYLAYLGYLVARVV